MCVQPEHELKFYQKKELFTRGVNQKVHHSRKNCDIRHQAALVKSSQDLLPRAHRVVRGRAVLPN